MPSPMYCIADISGGHLQTIPGIGFPGGVYSWYVGSLFLIDAFPAGVDQSYFVMNFGGASGGHILYQIVSTQLTFLIVQPGGAFAVSPFYTMSSSELHKIMSIVGVVDAVSAKLRLYVNGIQIGTGETITGYLPNAANPSRIGSNTADNAYKVYGAVYGTNPTPPTAQNVLDWHLACKSNRKVMPMGGGYPTDGMWRIDANSAVSGAPDLIGSADFDVIAGTVTVQRTFARFAA